MVEKPQFEPFFPAHAIERCGVVVVFKEPIPDKAFRKLADGQKGRLSNLGVTPVQSQSVGFMIDAANGKVVPTDNLGPTNFASADQSISLNLFPNAMTFANANYVRWSPFLSQFNAIAGGVLGSYLDSVSVSIIKLEYWDRFFWTGDWGTFEPSQLLSEESGLVVPRPSAATREWHSHIGWFEEVDGYRRLTNVNIDAIEAVRPREHVQRPSIGIYTTMQDEANVDSYAPISSPQEIDQATLMVRIQKLHEAMQSLFRKVITDDVASKVGLTEKGLK